MAFCKMVCRAWPSVWIMRERKMKKGGVIITTWRSCTSWDQDISITNEKLRQQVLIDNSNRSTHFYWLTMNALNARSMRWHIHKLKKFCRKVWESINWKFSCNTNGNSIRDDRRTHTLLHQLLHEVNQSFFTLPSFRSPPVLSPSWLLRKSTRRLITQF